MQPPGKDFTGDRYGLWTVLSYVGNLKWKIVCDCGSEKTCRLNNLRNGKSKSCGCLRNDSFAKDLSVAFWEKVKRGAPDACWEWTGSLRGKGYGQIGNRVLAGAMGSKLQMAHRVSAYLAGMDIEGKIVRHKCDNPRCVNPHHLETGTYKDNSMDMLVRERAIRKLTTAQVIEMREMRASGASYKSLAAYFGVATSTVNRVVNRKTHKHC